MAALTVQSSGFFPEFNKESIPIIHNVVSDEDLRKSRDDYRVLPSLQVKEVNFMKVLKLITDKHSVDLVGRHYRAVKQLTSCYKHGIHLRDVSILLEILKKCHERMDIDERYEDLVCCLISTLKNPFLKSKSSDEAKYLQSISEFFTDIGAICEASPEKVKVCLSSTISSLYTTTQSKDFTNLDLKPVSFSFIKSAIEKSRICKSIAECLGQVSNDSNRYVILKSLNVLSDSDLNCDDMLKTDAASCICDYLSQDVANYELLFIEVEIFWNLLEHGNAVEFSRQLSCESCLRSLLSTFIYQMNHCTSHADRQLRNDILVLLTLITSKCPEAPLVATGITKMIALYATYPELPSRNELVRNVKIQQSPEDFELKKLLLSTVAIMSVDKASVQVFQRHHVLLGLFTFIKPISDNSKVMWAVSEFEELQLHALSVLTLLAPLCVDEYNTCQGGTRLLALLDWCIGSDDFGGHGNSFHGVGGRGSKRAQMRYCIRLIRSMCSLGDDRVCQDFTDQGLITQLVAILGSCSQSTDSNDAVDVEMQCDMLLILAALCDGDNHRKELFGESGVNMLIQYLEGYVNVKNGPLNHTKLVLSATDCIWSTVINCFMNEVVFLEKEGAFLLLDLLEICPENMQNVVLGTIVDLTENKNTIPHILLWHGKNEKTVGKLLVDLWCNEEQKLGVKREADSVIADPICPLLTKHQAEQGIVPLPVTFASPAVVDVSDNLRAKIYSLFYTLGFNNVPGLHAADYIVLSVIEKYLDFKTLEVWQEIKAELEHENIEPVSSDKDGIEGIIEMLQEKASNVQLMQRELINTNFDHDLMDEQDFYDKIKESYKQEDKAYHDFVNFVDRTSDYPVLQKVRKEQLRSIDRSRLLSRGGPHIPRHIINHETLDRSLATTTFCGRNILVKSMRFNAQPATTAIQKNSSNEKRIAHTC